MSKRGEQIWRKNFDRYTNLEFKHAKYFFNVLEHWQENMFIQPKSLKQHPIKNVACNTLQSVIDNYMKMKTLRENLIKYFHNSSRFISSLETIMTDDDFIDLKPYIKQLELAIENGECK